MNLWKRRRVPQGRAALREEFRRNENQRMVFVRYIGMKNIQSNFQLR